MNVFESVYVFNHDVVGIGERKLGSLTTGELGWLTTCLQEEAIELQDSVQLVDQVDALCDSIIFTIGGFARAGLSPEQAEKCIMTVMAANFEKKAGQKAGRVVEGVADAVKPEGWVGPEFRIADILGVMYVKE